MKKAIITVLLILGISVYGEQLFSFGGGAAFQNTITADSDKNESTLGTTSVGINSTFFKGESIGIIAFFHGGIPMSIHKNNEVLNNSMYLKMSAEGIVGVGYLLNAIDNLKIVAGTGLHINGFFYDAMNSDSSRWETVVYSAFGLGIVSSFIYQIIPELSIGLNVNLGFDYGAVLNDPLLSFVGATSLNLGLSFFSSM